MLVEYSPDLYSLRNNGNSSGNIDKVEYMGENVFSEIRIKSAPCTDWMPDWVKDVVPTKQRPAITAINCKNMRVIINKANNIMKNLIKHTIFWNILIVWTDLSRNTWIRHLYDNQNNLVHQKASLKSLFFGVKFIYNIFI